MMRKRIRGNKWSIQSKMTNNFLISWPLVGRGFHQARMPVETQPSREPFPSPCWWIWSGYMWVTPSDKLRFMCSLIIVHFFFILCGFCKCVLAKEIILGPNSHCLPQVPFISFLIKAVFQKYRSSLFPERYVHATGFHKDPFPAGPVSSSL